MAWHCRSERGAKVKLLIYYYWKTQSNQTGSHLPLSAKFMHLSALPFDGRRGWGRWSDQKWGHRWELVHVRRAAFLHPLLFIVTYHQLYTYRPIVLLQFLKKKHQRVWLLPFPQHAQYFRMFIWCGLKNLLAKFTAIIEPYAYLKAIEL